MNAPAILEQKVPVTIIMKYLPIVFLLASLPGFAQGSV